MNWLYRKISEVADVGCKTARSSGWVGLNRFNNIMQKRKLKTQNSVQKHYPAVGKQALLYTM